MVSVWRGGRVMPSNLIMSWNNSENPKLQKSRSYVRMDSNAETKPTFHLPAMSKTEEPETPSDHFHNLHKKSDDAEFKMHLTMEDSLFDTGGTQINNQIFHTGTINLIEALRLESRHNEAVVDPMLDPPLKDKISSNLADLKGGNQSITFQGIVPLRSIAKVDDNTNKDGGDVWQSEQMCPIFCYHCFGNINPKLR
ncbi:uncharacterized protein LOC103191443 isoform X2 [Callorhinchus milii]|uniref:uncharacterized protein LOC103191443 isoform X2 n=1 Tax=Callorhinchus milii TaxID=7868 RepID=UPI0004575CD6|nr:uncharacterized protein LOC103191443 isoform X2 [Callorhinchus milii]|eukprot:gi/632987132/ref/XP_007910623.1/ PREDICTED: uncharacterized protein LOC103191443 isoform X2 [Callorhinchus milii]